LVAEDAQRPPFEVERRSRRHRRVECGRDLGFERHSRDPRNRRPRCQRRTGHRIVAWDPGLPPGGRMGTHARIADKWDLFDRAVDLVADGKLDEAVKTYEEAIALDPEFADAWQGMALALNDLGQHPRAIEAAKKLCELTPDDVLAHTTLSRLYQAAGMIPEAEAEGGKARILDWKRQLKEGVLGS